MVQCPGKGRIILRQLAQRHLLYIRVVLAIVQLGVRPVTQEADVGSRHEGPLTPSVVIAVELAQLAVGVRVDHCSADQAELES